MGAPLTELISSKWQSVCDIADEYFVTPTFVRAVLALPTYARTLEGIREKGQMATAS
ncbi:MAG TPA: hypothetical protein GX507_11560 [Clostridia bacterium]|nr:hypothetical protein [Clostridia bacterium]